MLDKEPGMEPQEPLVGPRAHEHESETSLLDSRLGTGEPLYHALLDDPRALTVSADDAQRAKSRLQFVASIYPEEVKEAVSMSLDAAHDRLTELFQKAEDERGAAA